MLGDIAGVVVDGMKRVSQTTSLYFPLSLVKETNISRRLYVLPENLLCNES